MEPFANLHAEVELAAGVTGCLTRGLVVGIARSWCGTPYHHQAARRGVGTDCLGLVRGIWRELYGDDPVSAVNYTRDWAEVSGQESVLEAAARHLVPVAGGELRPGQVVVFRFRQRFPAKHLAVVADAGRMIHAMEGHPVAEVPLVPWWHRRIAGLFDFPGVTD